MNSTLSWPIFANVPPAIRDRISSVYVFGKNGDKLIFFTNPTITKATPLPTPVPNNSPMPLIPPTIPPVPVLEPNSIGDQTVSATAGASPISGTSASNPDIVPVVVETINETITNVEPSSAETTFVSHEPEAFCLGKNTASCLGTGDFNLIIEQCKRIDILCGRKIVDVVAGERLHVLLLCDDGHVFAWGENRNGQVGSGSFDERVMVPSIIFEPDSFISGQCVVQIAVGSNHSVCLTNTGKVFAWGINDYGQLGDGTKINKPTPIRVEGVIETSHVIQIACCQRSTLALDDKGRVYQWGNNWNDNGMGLGQPITRPQDLNMTFPLFQNVRIRHIACGANHVLALSESSSVYSWGRNDAGQLGLGFVGDYGSKSRESAVVQPTKISHFSSMRLRIKRILAHNQMNVSLAQSYSGLVFTWGRQSSSGVVACRPTPTQFKTLEAAFAAACERPVTPRLQRIDHDALGNPQIGSPNWLRQMFDHKPSSDLEIVVDGQPIYVHRTVLKMGSAHYRAMLDAQSGWKESTVPTIKIEKVPYAAYRAYLFYLYSDELVLPPDVSQDDVVSLMDLASSQFEEDLKLKAIDFFASHWLDIDNAAAIYTLAVDHMLDELIAVAMEFILENLTAVVTSQCFSQIDAQHAKTIFVTAANRRLFTL